MAYTTLFAVYRGQPSGEVFADYRYDSNRGETWEVPYARLAELAKDEQWSFNRAEFRRPNVSYPILQNYLRKTFLRLQQEDKIRFSGEGKQACFNTGLVTKDEKELFALFEAHARRDQGYSAWFFGGFFDSYAQRMSLFRPLPELASYIEDASDLVFDVSYEVDINVGHMLDDEDNRQRLPLELQNNRTLALQALEGAVKLIERKIVRNYKTAIPMWYMPEEKIQLLLPLHLAKQDEADLALVADKDSDAKLYRIRTGLRMDQAYINARLLTRPDREWLNP